MRSYFYTTGSFVKYLVVFTLGAVILYFGRTLFVPMSYGLLIAIVLYPVCKWLENHGWPRSLAITAGLAIVLILFGALVVLLIMQFNAFRQDLPELTARLEPTLLQLRQW